MNSIWKTAGAFGTAIGILSVLALLRKAESEGWLPVFEALLEYYASLKSFILAPIFPLAETLGAAFARVLGITETLAEHWSDVFVLLSLYLAARAKSYWAAGLRSRSIFRVFWGVFISLATGVATGLALETTVNENVQILAVVTAGLILFDLVDAAWSATFFRSDGQPWLKDFYRYLEFSMPASIVGVSSTVGILFLFWTLDEPASNGFGVLALIGYAFVLAFYWMYRGYRSARLSSQNMPFFERFLKSSNTHISLLMLRSLGGALIVFAFNAGLN